MKRKADLKKFYGITLEDYDRILAAQGGKCAICGADEPDKTGYRKHFDVDHCVSTGRIRGIICTNCNNALGRFQHDENLLMKAIMYLRT